MRLLCVDDDPIFQEIYKTALETNMRDVEVTVASSGEEALQYIDSADFDVVVTDLKMGQISGLNVLEYIKTKSLTTEVIIITGVPSINTVVESMTLGARDYIEKPVSLPLLFEKLERIRSYQLKVREVEVYRLETENMEIQAANKIRQLEFVVEEMKDSVRQVLALLTSNDEEIDCHKLQRMFSPLLPFVV